MLRNLSLIFLAFLGLSCGGSSDSGTNSQRDLSSRDEIRLKQYMVEGKKLYTAYCSNCHQSNGQGLAQLYPPLAEADYLLEDLPRSACLIKHGKAEAIVVNGVTYNQMMPGNPGLAPLEIAEILTYVTNSWGNSKGISSTRDVTKWLEDCEKQ